MKAKERWNRIYWQWHNSDFMRYFHLSKYPTIIANALKYGGLVTFLYWVVIVCIWQVYGQTPNWFSVIYTSPVAFAVGAFMGQED